MVKALGSSDEAVFLQHRLDDMNQRWSDLKAKSANIRSVKHHLILRNKKCLFALVFVVMQLKLQVFCSFCCSKSVKTNILPLSSLFELCSELHIAEISF